MNKGKVLEIEAYRKRQKELILKEIHSLTTGSHVIKRILDLDNPGEFIKSLSSEDLFWIIKKVGEDDSIELLALATEEQWQYILDVEIWKKDRLDIPASISWLKRLHLADPFRLARWMFSEEGEGFSHLFFFKTIDIIIISDKDQVYDIPDGYVTFDGVYYFRSKESENQAILEDILRVMSGENLIKYQSMMLNIGGVIPAEAEEELYRLRNVRMAEHGFLPYEEAISIYSPLDVSYITPEKREEIPDIIIDDETRAVIPLSPMLHIDSQVMLSNVLNRINDPLLMDRIRIEFAGLCNQILSADRIIPQNINDLIDICRKAAGFLNIALERRAGKEISLALSIIKNYPLSIIFRVGFGLALKAKWEAQRWQAGSWFMSYGYDLRFWGDYWGGMLEGLLRAKPMFYDNKKQELRNFETMNDLSECIKVLQYIMVVDSLFEFILKKYPDISSPRGDEITFMSLIFTFWSRQILGLAPGFDPLTISQGREFFTKLRNKDKAPPYRMSGWKERFIDNMVNMLEAPDQEALISLKGALSSMWDRFSEEYEMVNIKDLDPRYSRFLLLTPQQ